MKLIGGKLTGASFVNGIRCVDKFQPTKKLLFRLEIWLNRNIDENTKKTLKNDLQNELKDRVEEKKIQ